MTTPTIQILRHENTDAAGWRWSDGDGRVYSRGQFRHTNGQWEVEDDVALDEAVEAAIEAEVVDSDVDALDKAISEWSRNADARAEAIEAERVAKLDDRQRRVDAAIAAGSEAATALYEELRSNGGQSVKHTCRDGRTRTFRIWNGQLVVAFYKQGGHREWMLPISLDQLTRLVAGTAEVRYIKRSNRGMVVDK